MSSKQGAQRGETKPWVMQVADGETRICTKSPDPCLFPSFTPVELILFSKLTSLGTLANNWAYLGDWEHCLNSYSFKVEEDRIFLLIYHSWFAAMSSQGQELAKSGRQ